MSYSSDKMIQTTNEGSVLARSERLASVWENRKAIFVCSFWESAVFNMVLITIMAGFKAFRYLAISNEWVFEMALLTSQSLTMGLRIS